MEKWLDSSSLLPAAGRLAWEWLWEAPTTVRSVWMAWARTRAGARTTVAAPSRTGRRGRRMENEWKGRPVPESAGIPAILAAAAGLHHSGHRTHHHREGVAGFTTGLKFSGDHPFRGGEGFGGGGTAARIRGQTDCGTGWVRCCVGGCVGSCVPGGGAERFQGNADTCLADLGKFPAVVRKLLRCVTGPWDSVGTSPGRQRSGQHSCAPRAHRASPERARPRVPVAGWR